MRIIDQIDHRKNVDSVHQRSPVASDRNQNSQCTNRLSIGHKPTSKELVIGFGGAGS